MSVHFEDNRVAVKAVMKEKAIAWLLESAGELVKGVNRNLDKEKGRWHSDQKEQWQYRIDEDKLEATIGNPMERTLWTEFGTGSFADGGKGRKGWWVYVKDENGGLAIIGKNGLHEAGVDKDGTMTVTAEVLPGPPVGTSVTAQMWWRKPVISFSRAFEIPSE